MLSQINDLVSKWIQICKLLIHFPWRNSFSHKCIQPICPNLCFFRDPFFHPQICSISNNLTIEAWFEIQKHVWIHNLHIWEFGLHLIINNIFTKFCLNKILVFCIICQPNQRLENWQKNYKTDNWCFLVPEGFLEVFRQFFYLGYIFNFHPLQALASECLRSCFFKN